MITTSSQSEIDTDPTFLPSRSNADLMRAAAQVAHLGSWEYDALAEEMTWSEKMCDLFGVSPGKFPPRMSNFLDQAHPEDREAVRESLRQMLHADKTFMWEQRILHPEGITQYVRLGGIVQRDGAGRIRKIIGVCQDISDLKRAEEKSLHSQRMESMGRLTAAVAHDFNNVLTVISGLSELLLRGDADMTAHLQEIHRAATHGSELTRQLLNFSRKVPLPPTMLDLVELVHDCEKLLPVLLGKAITLTVSVGLGPFWIRADPVRVEQTIFNLAANARDAMSRGGELRLEVSAAATAPHAEGGSWVVLRCIDNGEGMDEVVKSLVFEPFFTTKPPGKGTGLGMAQVQDTVRRCGGRVKVDSEPGRGTTVELFLPRVNTKEPAKTAESHVGVEQAAVPIQTLNEA